MAQPHGSATIMVPMSQAAAVFGQPFSADLIRRAGKPEAPKSAPVVQRLFRDGEGRTRVERLADGSPVLIEISDPIAGYYYLIDNVAKAAHRVKIVKVQAPAKEGSAKKNAYVPPKPSELPRPSRGADDAPGGIGLVDKGLPEVKGALILPGTDPNRPNRVDANAGGVMPGSESLGLDTIGGVEAEGYRTVVKYPQGMLAADKAVTRTNEIWVSNVLKLTVLEKVSDEVNGETVVELKGIQAAEPAAELFQVPAGYKVSDEPSMFTVRF